jgi:hypothetical protein
MGDRITMESNNAIKDQDEARSAIEAYVYKRNPDVRSVAIWLENWSSQWNDRERRKKELVRIVEQYGNGKKDKLLGELKRRMLV